MKSDGFDCAGKAEDVEFDCMNGKQKLRFLSPGLRKGRKEKIKVILVV